VLLVKVKIIIIIIISIIIPGPKRNPLKELILPPVLPPPKTAKKVKLLI